jgi:hypothetical protein
MINANPDATEGPPVTGADGNVMGGIGRGMTMQRVYANNPNGAQAYRDLLAQNPVTSAPPLPRVWHNVELARETNTDGWIDLAWGRPKGRPGAHDSGSMLRNSA